MNVGDYVEINSPEGYASAYHGMRGTVVVSGQYGFDYELAVELDAAPAGNYLYVPEDRLKLLVAKPTVKPSEPAAPSVSKDTNPKDAIAAGKLPLHLWPKTASLLGSLALLDGMLKYGRTNWRVAGVKASVYVDALERHVSRWFEGEDVDPESGVHHLGHALACLAILVDALAADKLVDDRQYPGGFGEMLDELTPEVARLKAKHADKAPRHYSIEDVE